MRASRVVFGGSARSRCVVLSLVYLLGVSCYCTTCVQRTHMYAMFESLLWGTLRPFSRVGDESSLSVVSSTSRLAVARTRRVQVSSLSCFHTTVTERVMSRALPSRPRRWPSSTHSPSPRRPSSTCPITLLLLCLAILEPTSASVALRVVRAADSTAVSGLRSQSHDGNSDELDLTQKLTEYDDEVSNYWDDTRFLLCHANMCLRRPSKQCASASSSSSNNSPLPLRHPPRNDRGSRPRLQIPPFPMTMMLPLHRRRRSRRRKTRSTKRKSRSCLTGKRCPTFP